MKILITGAGGQLGKEFQRSLQNYSHEVVALNREHLNIADIDTVEEALSINKPDIVLNCAAYNFVDLAEEDFDIAYKVNALGVKNLVAACKKHDVFLVHYSTDYVFDGRKENFYTEEDEPNPINKYGESKLSGERFLREEMNNFLLFRVSWVFGEGKQNFLYKLLEWAKKNNILRIVYDQISIPTYTRDIASITLFAIEKGLSGMYHLTNSGYASRYEVARHFIERIGMDNLILPVSSAYFHSAAQRPYFSALSNLKISNELNVDMPDWRVGIESFVTTLFEKEEI